MLPVQVYIALRADNLSARGPIIQNTSTGAAIGVSNPNQAYVTGNGTTFLSTTGMNTSADHVITAILNGSSSKIRVDDGSWVTGAAGAGELFLPGGVGGPFMPGFAEIWFAGAVTAVVVFDSILSTIDDEEVLTEIMGGTFEPPPVPVFDSDMVWVIEGGFASNAVIAWRSAWTA